MDNFTCDKIIKTSYDLRQQLSYLDLVIELGCLLLRVSGSDQSPYFTLMDSPIRVQRPRLGDLVVVLVLSMGETHLISVTYLAQQKELDPILIKSVSEGGENSDHPLTVVPSEDVMGVGHWNLRVGTVFFMNCVESIPNEEEEPEIVLNIDGTDGDHEDDVAIHQILVFRVSALDIMFKVKGASEILKFVAQFLLLEGELQHV